MATDNTKAGGPEASSTSPAVKKGSGPPRQLDVPEDTAGASARGSGISRRESQAPIVSRGSFAQGSLGLFRRMMEDMEQLFADYGLGRGLRSGGDVEFGPWSPRVDILERDGNLLVRADLPGMKQEDIRVEVLDDLLILEGERSFEQEEGQEDIWRMERGFGLFQRTLPLPEGIDADTIQARFENGVLEVSMKLPQVQAQGRRIEVKGSSRGTPKKPMH